MNRSTVVPLLVSLASACGSVPLRIEAPKGAVATTLSAAEFPGLAKMHPGFDPRSSDPAWESDDEVVFALRLRKGGEVHRWVLRLSVLFGQELVERLDQDKQQAIGMWGHQTWTYTAMHDGEPQELAATSLMLPVTAVVSDETGTKLSSSLVRLPVHLLGRGVLPAIDSALAAEAAPAAIATQQDFARSIRPMVDASIAMMALLHVVQEDDALADYFWQVVGKPSLWSVVTGLGVHATLSMPFEKSVPATTLPPSLPTAERAYVVPLQIDVNGSPALFIDVVAIDSARPYSVCGGMVAATARHPTKPDVTLELQLLSARLGKP